MMNRKQKIDVLGHAEPESFPEQVVKFLHAEEDLTEDEADYVEQYCAGLIKARPDWAPK